MAKCDEGYPCDVCGKDVGSIVESNLYLSFVIGELDPERLHVAKEMHIRCNPVQAQFIVDDEFEPIEIDGPLSKSQLDSDYVIQREDLVTRGFRRLKQLANTDELSMLEYPLPEVVSAMKQEEP